VYCSEDCLEKHALNALDSIAKEKKNYGSSKDPVKK
jgi:hypothetical protein